jgi:hypothetical protein
MTCKNLVRSIVLVMVVSGSGTILAHDGIHTWNNMSVGVHFLFDFPHLREILIVGLTAIWAALMHATIRQRAFQCLKLYKCFYVD